jgi:hypothetical protein
MFQFFYSIVWQLIEVLLPIAGLFNKKIRIGNIGRRNAISSLEKWQLSLSNKSEIIWFHCASLGEFEQGRPVMEALKKQHPNSVIALTFFSPSGYEVRKNYAGADWIGYLPLDTFFNARKFVNILRPKKAFFVKGSQWSTKEPSGTSPKLVSGENHWGYFSGLSSESPENWPMVVDGFKSEGVYSAKKTEHGGLWEGRSAIVVRLNGSAAKESLTDLKLVSDGQENALKVSDNWLTGATYASPN